MRQEALLLEKAMTLSMGQGHLGAIYNKKIETELAKRFISGKIVDGSHVLVALRDGDLGFEVQRPQEAKVAMHK